MEPQSTLDASSDAETLRASFTRQGVPEIHHSDQGVQYLSNDSISTLTQHGVEISVAHRGRPWENGYAERWIRTLKEKEVRLNYPLRFVA